MPQPAAPSPGNWLVLDDFTPGIWSENANTLARTAASPPLGSASTNTFRCYALPSGALCPLPRRVENITVPNLPDWADSPTYLIGGFNAELSNVLVNPPSDTNQSDRVELHFSVEYNVNAGADKRHRWLRYRIFDTGSPTWETISNVVDTGGASSTSRYAPIFHTRMNPAVPTDFGQTVTVMTWIGGNALTSTRIAKAFPDPSSASTVSTVDVGNPTSHAYIYSSAHQGRVVLLRFLTYSRGPNVAASINDNWYWTATNDNDLSSSAAAAFVLENPTGITDFISQSANQLVAIKMRGGGFMIQGDLDDPLITQLPNVVSPNGTDTIKGTHSSIGFVYSAGTFGVHLWNGADGSELISPQLDSNFCIPSFSQAGHQGQMARFGSFVVAPMNWLFDPTTRGWWRLEDIATLEVDYFSESAHSGFLYGAYHTIDNSGGAGNKQIVWKWDPTLASYSYQWESHPLPLAGAIDRTVKVREVALLVQGDAQTITVTFYNEAGTASTATTFTLTSSTANVPTTLRANVGSAATGGFVGRNIRVRVACDGSSGSKPAAVIHRLGIYAEEVAAIPQTA